MTARSVHLPVAAQSSLDALVDLGVESESLGYHRVWLPETWGRDAVTVLARLASETSAVGLGTSIVNTYSRSPTLVAQTATTLQEAADGRFRLGLGPSGPILIENWHGVDYGNPLRRTREYVEIVREVFAGEPIDYHGDIFELAGFRLRCDPPDPAPPVDVTGMGPKAVELAGRFADGWHGLLLTRDGLDERVADLERGAELGDRDPDDVRVVLTTTCCALEDGDTARDLVRQHLAFYVGGMGTFYRDALARQGHETAATQIYDAWQAGEHEAAMEAIPDAVLDELSPAGTPEEARAKLEAVAAHPAVDEVAIGTPRGASQDQIRATLAALAPGDA